MNSTRRVVITGMGVVSAAGVGAKTLWQAARDGRSCVREPNFLGRIAGASRSPRRSSGFDPTAYLDAKLLPFLDPVTQYLLVAADEAFAQSGISRELLAGPRTAAIIGTGIAGMTTIEEGHFQISPKINAPNT